MHRVEVNNVQEAVELATQYRNEGRYDWFRGQTLERTPYSTGVRLQMHGDKEAFAHNKRRIFMFCRWLEKTPPLAHLLQPENVHQLFAILQHYGIATYYLDFTTDPAVAGFFACDTETPPREGLSSIYCLNSADLMDFWDSMSQLEARKGAQIEQVVVDVSNLWRLQAQAGVFLYVNYNWDVDYPMDRIVFPYTGYPAAPTRDRIYPKDKSPLEHLLDQYFDVENTTFANERFREFLIEIQGNDDAMTKWESFERGLYKEAFVDAASVMELPSWDPSTLEGWHETPDERYHRIVGRSFRLQLGDDTSATAIGETIRLAVLRSLQSDAGQRGFALQFLLDDAPAELNAALLQTLLERAWNGMRTLPFTDEEIGDCLGRVALLHAIGFADITVDRTECLAPYFGPMYRVAFGPADGAGSGGWVSIEGLKQCLRADMRSLLNDEHRHRVDDIGELFKVAYNPRIMFEFEPFKRLFARDVIPMQVIDTRKFVLFNVASLSTFGTP